MYEWLFLRLMMLGAMVGGGVLLAVVGKALGRLRKRLARVRNARQREVLAAEYRANRIDIDRSPERPAPPLLAVAAPAPLDQRLRQCNRSRDAAAFRGSSHARRANWS